MPKSSPDYVRIEFKRPEIRDIEGFDPEALIAFTKKENKANPHGNGRTLVKAVKRMKWLDGVVLTEVTSMPNGLIYEEVGEQNKFLAKGREVETLSYRPTVWHRDGFYGRFDKLRVFRTSSQPLVGYGTFIVNPALLGNPSHFTANAISLAGRNWLEQYLGQHDQVVNKDGNTIDDLIIDLEGFHTLQPEPGQYVDGELDRLLHTSAPVMAEEPQESVIYRVAY